MWCFFNCITGPTGQHFGQKLLTFSMTPHIKSSLDVPSVLLPLPFKIHFTRLQPHTSKLSQSNLLIHQTDQFQSQQFFDKCKTKCVRKNMMLAVFKFLASIVETDVGKNFSGGECVVIYCRKADDHMWTP